MRSGDSETRDTQTSHLVLPKDVFPAGELRSDEGCHVEAVDNREIKHVDDEDHGRLATRKEHVLSRDGHQSNDVR